MSAPEPADVRWLAEPAVRHPTLVAAFTGWNDAGDAASNSVRQLIEAWDATPLAEIDPEEFTDFATIRPHVRLDEARARSIVWPTVGLWSASPPGGDVVLLLGPEPALRWRRFCEQIVGVCQAVGVPMMVTVGALLADVPHTRPVRVIGTATDEGLLERFDLQRSRYEGPTGIVGVLHDACATAGIASASLWAAVPGYAAQVPAPLASAALLERVGAMIGSPVPVAGLLAEGRGYTDRVARLIDQDPDMRTYVERLETMYDSGEFDDDEDGGDDDELDGDDRDDAHPDGSGDLTAPRGTGDDADHPAGTPSPAPATAMGDADPTGSDDLVAEVERFLRDHGSD